MRPGPWIVAVLLFSPVAIDASFIALVPDGNGGITEFVTVPLKAVYAIPIDSSGVSHPERARLVSSGFAPADLAKVERTTSGYLMSYRDAAENGYLLPLASDLSAITPPQAFGRELAPLACNGDVCATARGSLAALMFLDATGGWLRSVPMPFAFPSDLSISAAGDGFAVLRKSQAMVSRPWDVEIEFVSRTGQTTGTATVATGSDDVNGITVVPHPLGLGVFWRGTNQIGAALVRTDGGIAAAATYSTPDLALSRIFVAFSGGQFALAFDTYTMFGGPPHTFIPPTLASYVMRLSDSLSVLEGPVRLAPGAVSAESDAIAASGDAFFVAWSATDTPYPSPPSANWSAVYEERLLRIPLIGSIDPKASRPLPTAPSGRRRTTR